MDPEESTSSVGGGTSSGYIHFAGVVGSSAGLSFPRFSCESASGERRAIRTQGQ